MLRIEWEDLRLRLGKALTEHLWLGQMLRRAGAAPHPQHRRDAAVALSAIVERAHRFDQLDQRCVWCGLGVDAGKVSAEALASDYSSSLPSGMEQALRRTDANRAILGPAVLAVAVLTAFVGPAAASAASAPNVESESVSRRRCHRRDPGSADQPKRAHHDLPVPLGMGMRPIAKQSLQYYPHHRTGTHLRRSRRSLRLPSGEL